MAKKGDWVRIHSIVLKADERTAKLPEDTQKCDLEMWTKGFLQDETAEIGDIVTVETAVGTTLTAMASLFLRSSRSTSSSEKLCTEVTNNGISKRL